MANVTINSTRVRQLKVHKAAQPEKDLDRVERFIECELSNGRVFSMTTLEPIPRTSPGPITAGLNPSSIEDAEMTISEILGNLPDPVKISYDSISPFSPTDAFGKPVKLAPHGSMTARHIIMRKTTENAVDKLAEEGLPKE